MTEKVLIFGGTGFIGRNLSKFLAQNDYEVKSFDNNERGHDNLIKENDIEYIKGDVCNFKDVKNAISGIDIVFNLAYINGTKNFYKIPGRILEIAATGQLNIGTAINQIGIKKFIYASSSEAYQTPKKFPTTEEEALKVPNPHNPRYSYGGGKIFGELCTLHHVLNVETKMIFRPHNVYGPRMGDDHVIPELFKKIQNSLQTNSMNLEVIGSPSNSRSFIFIEDAVNAIKLILEKGRNSEIYNVGSGLETSISDLVDKMISLTGKKIKANFNSEGHEGGVSKRLPDISKLKSLGYQNKVNLIDGLNICWEKINK